MFEKRLGDVTISLMDRHRCYVCKLPFMIYERPSHRNRLYRRGPLRTRCKVSWSVGAAGGIQRNALASDVIRDG